MCAFFHRSRMKLASGHEVTPLEGEELARQERDWTGYTEGMVRLYPGSWVFPAPFTDYADKIYNFEVSGGFEFLFSNKRVY